MKLFIDPGHGGHDPGATANGLVEKELTLAIGLALEADFKGYQGITTRLSRRIDRSMTLKERSDEANWWGADYFISIHINAGGGQGFESYIWNGDFANKGKTKQLQSTIHKKIVNHVDAVDRGQKEANFHVLRETRMPALLTENGFIDTLSDANLMKDKRWIKAVAQAHGLGVRHAFKLTSTTVVHQVVTGSFQQKQNAYQYQTFIKSLGYDCFIEVIHQNQAVYYRVVTGSFHNQVNAENRVRQLKEQGIEAFIHVK